MFCMHVCFVPHASLGTGVIVSHQVGAVIELGYPAATTALQPNPGFFFFFF